MNESNPLCNQGNGYPSPCLIVTMDLTDIRILQALGIRFFGPDPLRREDLRPADVASRVQLDEKTVRTRLARMQETGFLAGYDLYPNLRLFGLREGVAYFFGLDPDQKEQAFQRLERTHGLTLVHDFFKAPFCVVYTYPESQDKDIRLAELAELVGRDGEFVAEADPPHVPETPSMLDWRLMALLRHDALMPAVEAASRLGVATRTVRRRLDRLARNNAYYVFPRLDPTKGEGLVFVSATVWPDETRRLQTVKRVREAISRNQFLEADSGSGAYYATLAAPGPAAAESLERALQRTDGVVRAEVNLLQRAMDYGEWVDQYLDHQIGTSVMTPS